MVNTSTNVVVAAPATGGGALVAPVGTALPTTNAATINVAFVPLGYLGDNGITDNTDRPSKKVYAFGGDTIATTQDSFAKSFKFTITEYLNATAKAVVHGDSNVTTAAATSGHGTQLTITEKAAQLPVKSWVFDIVSGNALIRKVIPNGRVTNIGDVVFQTTAISGQEITIDCYPDSSGNYVYTYTDDGVKSA